MADLSHLGHSYVSAYRPTTADRKKYRTLKDLKKKQNIVILKPDKGNGVVVLDRIAYGNGILKIINDTLKFRPTKENPTVPKKRLLSFWALYNVHERSLIEGECEQRTKVFYILGCQASPIFL